MMVDIDHFKKINDQYGHAIGDQVLAETSGRIQEVLRAEDLWARFGGEEFVAMLPATAIEGAVAVAERVRQSISDVPFVTAVGELRITVSIGVATRQPEDVNWETVNQLADAALYRAKSEGRNRVAKILVTA
jgi:diguanylate cyclase (GGDEF)-like protein